MKDLKVRQSIEITCSKLSSFVNFETELENSHRQQDIIVCTNDGENLGEKVITCINPEYRFWISTFKWLYWLSHLLKLPKEVGCSWVNFMDMCVSKYKLCYGLHLPSMEQICVFNHFNTSSWKSHHFLEISDFRK